MRERHGDDHEHTRTRTHHSAHRPPCKTENLWPFASGLDPIYFTVSVPFIPAAK